MLSAVCRSHNGHEHDQSVYGDYRQQHGRKVQHWISLRSLTHSEGFGFGSRHRARVYNESVANLRTGEVIRVRDARGALVLSTDPSK
jgi:hypothetical protein